MNKIIKGRYILKECIARGGMGEVWICFDNMTKLHWAIKIIKSFTIHPTMKSDPLKEVEILTHLKHPGIPKIKDYIVEQPYHYIVMEYIKGSTLYHKVEKEGKQDEYQVLKWGLELCDIFLYLHSMAPCPIIYRDLKPDNILLDENQKIKLVDFGISCYQMSDEYFTGPYLGTLGYASPEQVRFGSLDIRSDIYNFGSTLIYLLTGSTYSGNFSSCELQSISKLFYCCLKRCLMHRPSKRFQTMGELKKELSSIIDYHHKKRVRVRIINISVIVCLILSVVSYISFNIYHTWHKKELCMLAMQNGDYQSAIEYQCTNVEPYALYYLQCIQIFADSDYKEGIKHAIQQIELFDTSKIENPEMLFYQIAQDCLFINTIEYYEKAFEYFSKIAHVDNKIKKEIELYLNMSSLLKHYPVLNEDDFLRLNNLLYDLYNYAQEEVDENKKLTHYFTLLEILMSRSNELGQTSYNQILEVIHAIHCLWNNNIDEGMISNKFSKINLMLYEMLAYYHLGIYEQNQKNDALALQNYNNMHILFDEYQKKYEVNENLLVKVALTYLYKFEIEQQYQHLQYAKIYYEKVLSFDTYHEVAKKGLEYIAILQGMMN